MATLEVYHHTLCPFSRKLRIVLTEKKIDFELVLERYWERREAFMSLNPAGETPVIIMPDTIILSSNTAIFEYLEEVHNEKNLIGTNALQRAFIRRVCDWFDNKFYLEVSRYLIMEKVIKVISKTGEPNSNAIRAAKKNLTYHLDYIAYLLKENDYLCGEVPSLGDFAAAAQLSVLDFLGDVSWDRDTKVKHWYSLIKSRPSFKSILNDKLPHFHPPQHYSDPDF